MMFSAIAKQIVQKQRNTNLDSHLWPQYAHTSQTSIILLKDGVENWCAYDTETGHTHNFSTGFIIEVGVVLFL